MQKFLFKKVEKIENSLMRLNVRTQIIIHSFENSGNSRQFYL